MPALIHFILRLAIQAASSVNVNNETTNNIKRQETEKPRNAWDGSLQAIVVHNGNICMSFKNGRLNQFYIRKYRDITRTVFKGSIEYCIAVLAESLLINIKSGKATDTFQKREFKHI